MENNLLKEIIEIGFVKVQKGLCQCNYRVNVIIDGHEEFADEHFNHYFADATIYRLLKDAKGFTIENNENNEKLIVKVSEYVYLAIYRKPVLMG